MSAHTVNQTHLADECRPLVIIPSYNTGSRLLETVAAAAQFWSPVWVVIDGSTDPSAEAIFKQATEQALASGPNETPPLRAIRLPKNQGKGAAVLKGFELARDAGFTHALVMDADGQHPAEKIPRFMSAAQENPNAMVLGEPEFAEDAPKARRYGRRVGNWWADLETLWGGIHDSLFGFRVYPIKASIDVLSSTSLGRRYDFDTQLAVRLYWKGYRPINIKVPVKYLSPSEGGVSHFHYLRDNFLLTRTHVTLVSGMLPQIPRLLRLKAAASSNEC